MQFNRQTVTTLFMVALVALAGIGAFAGGAAAETTTLAGDGTDEVSGFTAAEGDHLEYDLSASDTDFATDGTETVYLEITQDNDTIHQVETTLDDTSATSHTFNVSHDDLSELSGDAGESVTVSVSAWGEDGEGTETTTAETFDATVTFANTHAAAGLDESDADTEETETGGYLFGAIGAESTDLYTYESTVGVDGDATSVTVTTEDGVTEFEDAMGEDLESEDLITGTAAAVDGTPVLAFYESADSDLVNETSDTFAVYEGDGEWTIELGDDYSDASEVDLFLESQSYTDASAEFDASDMGATFIESADFGFTNLSSNFGVLDTVFSFDFGDLLPF